MRRCLKRLDSFRIAEYERIIRSVADWAEGQKDIVGVAVVGSWARNQERMDSDQTSIS